METEQVDDETAKALSDLYNTLGEACNGQTTLNVLHVLLRMLAKCCKEHDCDPKELLDATKYYMDIV